MPDRWVLEFRDYPPSPNVRLHYMRLARERARWRANAWATAKAAGVDACERIRVSAVIVRRVLGRADEDNDRARLKPIWDGLVDAGVIPDDRRGLIEHGPVTEERGNRGLRIIVDRLA